MNRKQPIHEARCVLVTGGAGFVGANLAIAFKRRYPRAEVIALDNLRRRGSELNIARLKAVGIEFVHGDVRNREDLSFRDRDIDLIIDCSAEPSALAGYGESPLYVVHSNLLGAVYCLEVARQHQADVIFFSTSRVYPHTLINSLAYREEESRFSLTPEQPLPGVSEKGIAENFPLEGARTLYGATKLGAEFLVREYAEIYGIRVVVNRCGVIAGPWQMGKIDQGIFTFWMAAHYFKRPLQYIGFGGSGKQVRDVLHIQDLFRLTEYQIERIDQFNKSVYNVGGGISNSLSLQETTRLCQEITGNKVEILPVKKDRPGDMKYYVSDTSRIEATSGWKPKHQARKVLEDIFHWIQEHEHQLKEIL